MAIRGSYTGTYTPNQDATERAGALQNRAVAASQQLLANQQASEQLWKLTGTPGSHIETNGLNINASTGSGGSGSGSRTGGMAIGGGVYPNVSMSQFNSQVPKVNAPGRVPHPTVPSTTGAFAHAKDVAGRQGNKAMEALANEMSRRGMSDSGAHSAGMADILGGVGRQQADAEYQAANIDNTRQWEANQLGYQGDMAQNEMNYQGGIAQRGQDVQAFLSMLRQLY